MSLADYAVRKYDFLAFQGATPNGEAQLDMALYSGQTAGKICVGAQKLTQRWVLEFLTEKGSMPGLPDRGCDFMAAVRQGRLRTQLNVEQSFYASALRVRTALQLEEYDAMPADERLDDAELLSVVIGPGYLNLRVAISSVAGDARTIILPVETLP